MIHNEERGAAAVELAIVLPIILALLFGIIEFGRAYNASIVVTHAARESVRKLALKNPVSEAEIAGRMATEPLLPKLPSFHDPVACTAGVTNAKITVKFAFAYDIPFFNKATINMSKTATMLCGG